MTLSIPGAISSGIVKLPETSCYSNNPPPHGSFYWVIPRTVLTSCYYHSSLIKLLGKVTASMNDKAGSARAIKLV